MILTLFKGYCLLGAGAWSVYWLPHGYEMRVSESKRVRSVLANDARGHFVISHVQAQQTCIVKILGCSGFLKNNQLHCCMDREWKKCNR
jgi:hypothetical protein